MLTSLKFIYNVCVTLFLFNENQYELVHESIPKLIFCQDAGGSSNTTLIYKCLKTLNQWFPKLYCYCGTLLVLKYVPTILKRKTCFTQVCTQKLSSFLTATFEMCGNYSFRPAEKLIKSTSVEMSVNSSYCFVNNICSGVVTNVNLLPHVGYTLSL